MMEFFLFEMFQVECLDLILLWEEVEDKECWVDLMEVYVVMVDCMDQGIGCVFEQLEVMGVVDDMFVFFFLDNGVCVEFVVN